MTRPPLLDFRTHEKEPELAHQFMFGPAFMACPVTDPMYYGVNSTELKGIDKSRQVYLPGDGLWYNFWTGQSHKAGQTIKTAAPIDYIPVFVRAGSIVPMGPVKQYSWEESDEPLEVRIYKGADGSFVLYEDEGDNYNYENGAYSTIEFIWNDKANTLLIGKRQGSFDGMELTRKFNIVLVSEGNGVGIEDTTGVLVDYSGKKTKVKL